MADAGARALAADLLHDVLEHLAVLTALDGVEVGTDQLDAVLLQRPAVVQRDRGVQRGLPAEGGEHGVDGMSGVALGSITFSTNSAVIGSM